MGTEIYRDPQNTLPVASVVQKRIPDLQRRIR